MLYIKILYNRIHNFIVTFFFSLVKFFFQFVILFHQSVYLCVGVFHFENSMRFSPISLCVCIKHINCQLSNLYCTSVYIFMYVCSCCCYFYLDCPSRSQSSIFSSSGSSIASGTACRQISYLCRRLSSIWLCSFPSSYFFFVSVLVLDFDWFWNFRGPLRPPKQNSN